MNWTALRAPFLRYTLLAAVATVGAAYLVFQSGLPLLLLTGAGILLVVLGAGEAGAAPAAGVEAAEDTGMDMMAEDTGMGTIAEGMELLPGSGSDYPIRAKLLFYGLGLVIWGVVGLAILLR